jgi:chromosome segregation protein
MLPQIIEQLKHYKSTLKSALKQENERKAELDGTISDTQKELNEIETSLESLRTRYQDERAKESLIALQKEDVQREIDELKAEINHAENELDQIQPVVEEKGSRVETDRHPIDISSDIKVTMAHLALLSEVSEDVEKIYKNYLNVYKELEDKSLIVAENREKALEELEERKKVWRKLLKSLLGDVNPTFQSFLEPIGARGWVKLIDTEDVETAGLELIVGFKGATPQVLDSRTQSGGERSSATMAFLLALQRHIKSPFRAVDEFDVHMDPKNRETVSHMLLKEMEKETDTQYLTITPGQVTNVAEGVRVITVQNVMGKSEVQVYNELPRQEAVN